MGSDAMGNDTKGRFFMKNARLRTKGFSLIASLLLLLLLSGMAIGLMMMVNTEGKVGATDLQNNLAYHAAEGGIEKMYSDLSAVFKSAQAPTVADICSINSLTPTLTGITFPLYQVQPGGTVNCSSSTALQLTSEPSHTWGNITSGPNQGLYAQIIPVNMTITAQTLGAQEVSMTRQAQVALIPVFQFGMFCDGDCSIFPGSPMTFAGPVHANGDFYPFANGGSFVTFQSKVAAYGNIVRTVLPNTFPSDKPGTIYVPTSSSTTACSQTSPSVAPSTTSNSCTAMAGVSTSSPWGDGSVQGLGGNPPQSSYSTAFNGWSTGSSGANGMVINGNYGNKTSGQTGTGAKKLSMPFVSGTTFPYEIIRRPPPTSGSVQDGSGESSTSLLGESREYNMAQIRVLLSDDPAEFQNGTGASDSQNVRLANVAQTSTTATQWGVKMAAGNYVAANFGTPSAGSYNLYFASASNAVPSPSLCAGTACSADDWGVLPLTWTAAMASAAGVAFAAPNPATQPFLWSNPGTPTISLCPPSNVISTSVPPVPSALLCPWTGAYAALYPYYAPPNPALPTVSGALTPYNYATDDAWSLVDGWLRVEYLDKTSGNWVPVTNEWLSLGFARGVTAPTANGAGVPATGTSNPINPNAILILQQPADRNTTPGTLATMCTAASCPAGSLTALSTGTFTGGGVPINAYAPACTSWSGAVGTSNCLAWTPGRPPQLPADTLALAASGTSATTGKAGVWAFGVTPSATSATTPQSITMYNWYPINFYDVREGEPRDIDWSGVNGNTDNSCTTNGVMNAVEIDVGNLKRWLSGSISGATSGTNVNSAAQNGYILYFSDRRGMLPSPNAASSHPLNTKTGDSGLEDTINSSSVNGVPDGTLETRMTGQLVSPEDDNGNTLDDKWGAYNLGLGFNGTVASAAQNLNTLIVSTNPNPNAYGSDAAGDANNRIKSCGRTARKNWVSGARHVLKLVDGSLGNLPLNPSPIVITNPDGSTSTYNGGFTVASENPVYIQGDYNSNAADTTWTTGVDKPGMAAAAVIADAVTLLSNNWDDRVSMLGTTGNNSPTNVGNRPTVSTYYRVAIAAGKNMTFTYPTSGWPGQADDTGTDGGIHNYLHLLENWGSGGVTENYKGSMASLFYSTYNTGFYKCCNSVYGVPVRNFIFDVDFENPYGLPPGTPMFRDVESLSYRQLFTPRTN